MLTVIAINVISSLVVTLILTTGKAAAKAGAATAAAKALDSIFSIANLSGIKGFDEPYQGIAIQAIAMLGNFLAYANKLVIVCAFLCIIFNSFKLWAGTIELKKVYIDMIYKATMCIAVMTIYPLVVQKVYTLATELGVEASGGYSAVMTSFTNMAKKTQEVWQQGMTDYVSALKDGANKTEDGTIVISDSALKVFTKSGMTEEEAKAWAASNGIKVDNDAAESTGHLWWKSKQKNAEDDAYNKVKNNKNNYKMMKQSLSIMRGLQQLLVGEADGDIENGSVDLNSLMTMGNDQLNKIFYNPYIGDTKILSASTMIKTAIVISDMASSGCLAMIDNTGEKEKEIKMKEISEGSPTVFLGFIGTVFKSFLYKLGMILAMIFIMFEYIMCIIEYLIVVAVSTLLIPLLFIDATKQFATNILKTLFAYFVKIMVTTMMCFFTIGIYIDLGAKMCGKTDLNSLSTILVYLFTLLFGVFLCKNSGKVAGAVISGNPSLGLGDVASEFRSASQAMHVASHHMDNAWNKATGVAKDAVNAGVSAGVNYGAGKAAGAELKGSLDSIGDKAMGTGQGAHSGSSDGIFGGAFSNTSNAGRSVKDRTARQGFGQQIGDQFFKGITGQDKGHTDEHGVNNGYLKVGQKFTDAQGRERTATIQDVKIAAQNRAKENQSKVDQKFSKKFERKFDKERNPLEPENGL